MVTVMSYGINTFALVIVVGMTPLIHVEVAPQFPLAMAVQSYEADEVGLLGNRLSPQSESWHHTG